MIVTVIISSFNYQLYVAQAIESVLDQTWPDVDLVVIDDGSTDNSPEIISDLHSKRGGFRFVSRENRGLLETLNQGLEMAKGELVCELASDDFLPPDSIEKRAIYLKKHPDVSIVFSDGISVDEKKITGDSILDQKRREMFDSPDPVETMIKGTLPVFATAMFRKEAIDKIGGFDTRFRYYEDLDTPILLCVCGKEAFMDWPVLYRREHDSNISRTTKHIRTEKVICYEKLLQEPVMAPYRRLISFRLRRSYLALGRHIRASGGTAREREIFQRAGRYVWRDFRLLWHWLRNKN